MSRARARAFTETRRDWDASVKAGRLRLARVAGIPVYLHASWLVLFGLVAWSLATGFFPAQKPDLPVSAHWIQGLVASLLLFVSILLHELGHALVAQRNGLATESVTLFVFGGVARLKKDPDDGRAEIRIALVGPLVSLGLSGLFALLAAAPQLASSARGVARYLALINLILALFNLVPAFPLDGGRFLRGLLWNKLGKLRATRAAADAGSLFALALMAGGVLGLLRGAGIAGIWYIAIGWFLKDAAGSAYEQARLDQALRGVAVREAMLAPVDTLPGELSLAEAARDHFLHTGYGSYPVTRGASVVGLLCLRDLLRVPDDERPGVSVQAAMRPIGPELVVEADEPLLAGMAKLGRSDAARLLVMDRGRFVGLLTLSAVVRHVRVREELAA
jgi:Zn-dependent protease/CBS domain-containing protein